MMPMTGSMNTQPNKLAGRQPENGEDRDGGIGHDVYESHTHIVVAVRRGAGSSGRVGSVVVLGECQLVVVSVIGMCKVHTGDELMRLRYFLDRFQVRASIGEGENLAGPARPFGLQATLCSPKTVLGS